MNAKSVLLLISLLWLTTASTATPSMAKQNCQERCGDVTIPYPFGIGKDCYLNVWFAVNCNDSFNPPTPYLSHPELNLKLTFVSLAYQLVTVISPMAVYCQDHDRNRSTWKGIDLSKTPFFYSEGNALRVVGCANSVLITRQGTILAGCSSICDNSSSVLSNGCYGINCCKTTVPSNLDFYILNTTWSTNMVTELNCTYAAFGRNFILRGKSSGSGMEYEASSEGEMIWMIKESVEGSDCHKNTVPDGALGNHSYYSCSCPAYQEGNPYLPNGCQVVEVCANCKGRCLTRIDGRFFCDERSLASKFWILGISLGGGLLFLLLGGFWLYKVLRRRRKIKLREQFFQQQLLQHQMSSNEISIENTKIFTFNELKKASDNFNENRILGRGGQGTVYKGMLTDGRIVAIKKSKIVDESQYEQFINEIVILSQLNHRNIVKLLGCCLEIEVPLLVYEFISHGTLFQLIHDENNELPFSWERRLEIATEVAGALAYLHSASSTPIFHRDIKSKNILLDEKYRAKVADFGTSRSVSIDQTHLTTLVRGTFGYLDPEYFRTGQFTEKSDVYSFGIVLVELLTGQKPISSTRTEEERSLASYFILSIEETNLFDILDAQVVKEGGEEEIMAVVNVATQCLNLNGKKRPTMKEVALELERVKSHLPLHVRGHFELAEYIRTEIIGPSDCASSSTGSGLTYRNTPSLNENSSFSNTL